MGNLLSIGRLTLKYLATSLDVQFKNLPKALKEWGVILDDAIYLWKGKLMVDKEAASLTQLIACIVSRLLSMH